MTHYKGSDTCSSGVFVWQHTSLDSRYIAAYSQINIHFISLSILQRQLIVEIAIQLAKKIPKINLEHKLSQCLPFIFVQVQHFFLGYSDLENRGKHDNYYYSPWLKTYIVLVFF